MVKKKKRTERTREAIIGAAMLLFSEKGYEETSLQDIAAAAKVSTSTLYSHFPQKDSLLSVSFNEINVNQQDELSHLPTLKDKLYSCFVLSTLAAVDNHMVLVHSIKMHKQYLDSIAQRNGEYKNERKTGREEMLRRILAEAQEKGEISSELDAEIISRIFITEQIAAYESIIVGNLTGDVKAHLERWFRVLMSMIS